MRSFSASILASVSLAALGLGAPFTAKSAPATVQMSSAGAVGFCAQLGCGDGTMTVELCRATNLVVHALEPNPAKAAAARAKLQALGLYGQASVEEWPEKFLPYADNLLNLLVVENAGGIPDAELVRVLAPNGTLWLRRDGAWTSLQKPKPAEFDEWTHWRHGADGNMVSKDTAVRAPSGPRWIAGPPQDDGGRKWYYDHVLLTAGGRNYYVYEDAIVARDAFNGRLLWTQKVKAVTFSETGTPGGDKLGRRTSKVRPVASGDRLYVATETELVWLDGANGKQAFTFTPTQKPREIALVDNVLLLSDKTGIHAFAPDGRRLWDNSAAARRMVAGDGKVFFVEKNIVGCLDLKTGQTLWRKEHAKAEESVTCTYFKGTLVLERSSWKDDAAGNGVIVLSAKDGAVAWQKDYTPGMTHYKEARSFFAQGLVWLQEGKQKFVGFDPQTGGEQKQWASNGKHCAAPIATENYIIAPELEFTDLANGEQTRAHMVKSACRLPFIPANGLLYTFPVQCECFPMLRGYMGIAAATPAPPAASPRLQPGPAFDKISKAKPGSLNAADWPMYRHDVYRSASTSARVPAGRLPLVWQAALENAPARLFAKEWLDDPFSRGLITPPVCAGNTVLVALPHRHRVVALDAATGQTRWTFTAGGRVDTPPSVAGGCCVFGSHDGYVYCVEMTSGQLAWRYRLAPRETRIATYGQLESLWPVGGGVLVENGVAYAAAGRHPCSDGGLQVCALQIQNGQLLWEKNVTDPGVTAWYCGFFKGTRTKVGIDYEPVDLLVKDGRKVSMSRWQFEPANGKINLAFTETNYEAFAGIKIPRGAWSYGIRQTKQVAPKPPAAFTASKLLHGAANDFALVITGDQPVRADDKGVVFLDNQPQFPLASPPVRDGLAIVAGRLIVAGQDGRVYCYGK